MEDTSGELFELVLRTNLFSVFYVSREFARQIMAASLSGCIVNVSSVSARRPTPGTAAYGAAKAGVESLTATLQTALSKPGGPARYLTGRRMVLKEAALAAGASPREAARLSMNGPSLAPMEFIFTSRVALSREKTGQSSPADLELTDLSIQSGQHLAGVPGLAVGFQQRLAQLDREHWTMRLERAPDAMRPETGQNVREYLEQRRLHPPEEEALLGEESAVTRLPGEMPDPIISK